MKSLIKARWWRVYAVWGLLLTLSANGNAADGSMPTYYSRVSEVRLTLFASDNRGNSLTGLRADDFAVVDNDLVVRDFRSFNISAETRLDLVILVDSSESVLPYLDKEIAQALRLISKAYARPGDQVSVVTFEGMVPQVICAGECQDALTADKVATLRKGGDTPLVDAVDWAARFLSERKDPAVRPVILLFSDGEDTSSKISPAEMLESLLASEAQLYAVDVHRSDSRSRGSLTLRHMAEASGGRYLNLDQGAERLLDTLIDDLRSAYVVTYAPPRSATDFHAIRVLPTRNLNLRFRCRRGYYDAGSNHTKRNP